jgi:transcriptional regulator with XRE-family HTH domain
MVMKLMANGARIKELRISALADLPQKTVADQCGISERQLRRVENQNLTIARPTLERLAKVLGVDLGEIAFGVAGPKLVSDSANTRSAPQADINPEFVHLPRHTTTSLVPVSGAQGLYDLAEMSREIIPHVLVDVPPIQIAMIEECLEILKTISERKWSYGCPVTPDSHDLATFPDMSRRRRLAELCVLLKGNDIRILAESELYRYPPEAEPYLCDRRFCFHLVIAFAPPRGEYEEERLTVPFDSGLDLVLPYKLPSF